MKKFIDIQSEDNGIFPIEGLRLQINNDNDAQSKIDKYLSKLKHQTFTKKIKEKIRKIR